MTYAEAKERRALIETEVSSASAQLNNFPKLASGLVPDDVRLQPEWQTAKRQYDSSFKALRKFNQWFTKAFMRDIREERRATNKQLTQATKRSVE